MLQKCSVSAANACILARAMPTTGRHCPVDAHTGQQDTGQQEIGIPSYGVDSNKPWLVWVSLINCFGKYVRFECGGCYSGMGSTLCEVEYPGKKEYTSTLKAKKLQ